LTPAKARMEAIDFQLLQATIWSTRRPNAAVSPGGEPVARIGGRRRDGESVYAQSLSTATGSYTEGGLLAQAQ